MTSTSNPHPAETGAAIAPLADCCESGSGEPCIAPRIPAPLPRRDWVLLPLVAVATVVAICMASETIAHRAFPDFAETPLDCLVLNDPSMGVHALPNSSCRGKLLEGPIVEYRFNRCGHRAGIECGPAPPNVLRVVLIGSSATEGHGVPREQSFAAMLPAMLSQRTGRTGQVYDAAMEFGTPLAVDLQLQHTLSLKPDVIVWPMATWQFSNVDLVTFARGNGPPNNLPAMYAAAAATFHKQGFAAALGVAIGDSIEFAINSRSVFMLRHTFYLSEALYAQSAKMKPAEVNFLRVRTDPASLQEMEQFVRYTGEIEAKAKTAHVPIVVTMLPLRLQASMISLHEGPPEFNPYQPARFTRSVVESNGGIFIDVLPAFEHVPSPGRFYYAVNGHPNAAGHALVAHILADALTSGSVPALAARKVPAQSPQAQPAASRARQ